MNRWAIGIISLLVGLLMGGFGGFMIGVWSTEAGKKFLVDMVATEAAADIDHPVTVNRKYYTVQYPGNWKEDKSSDSDPQYWAYFESPGGNYISFVVMDDLSDTAINVKEQAEVQKNLVKNSTSTRFTRWGRYKGEGIELKGRILGINRGGVRIFSYSSDTKSFIVTEQFYDEDKMKTEAAFTLAQSSFKLKD